MSNFFPLRYGTTVADGAQLIAITECLFFNTRDAGGNNDFGQRIATIKSLIPNTCDTSGDRNRFERIATAESPLSNTLHTIGDNQGGQGVTMSESPLSNTRHTIGNNGILAAIKKGIGSGVDKCVAILSAVIHGVTFRYYNRGKG